MKILILKDKIIEQSELNQLTKKLTSWYELQLDITPTFFIEEKNYTNYPTYVDNDNDTRPTDAYLRSIGKDVSKRYSGEGTDHVVLLIHETNWKSTDADGHGIWGTNYSNVYSGYQLHYVRYDKDNIANSFGTFYHEMHHSFDALIKTYEGVTVEKLIAVNSWDRAVTHGGDPRFKYIRYKDNAESLQVIKGLLASSYKKRDMIYQQKVGGMVNVISLLEKIIILIRQLNTMKSGVNK